MRNGRRSPVTADVARVERDRMGAMLDAAPGEAFPADIAMALLLIALFHRMTLGVQVVIEDYVHSAMKLPALIAMRFACFELAVAGILATVRIALDDRGRCPDPPRKDRMT